ncbi:MAG: hypothetical protein Q7L07_15510 [Pseudohongiella sp.]|nr:hypothetical protein [Pseudohongiella sp.]MDP2285311.1 hypothetical protein [Pseudohongiella sp.]
MPRRIWTFLQYWQRRSNCRNVSSYSYWGSATHLAIAEYELYVERENSSREEWTIQMAGTH